MDALSRGWKEGVYTYVCVCVCVCVICPATVIVMIHRKLDPGELQHISGCLSLFEEQEKRNVKRYRPSCVSTREGGIYISLSLSTSSDKNVFTESLFIVCSFVAAGLRSWKMGTYGDNAVYRR
jgi:hypothetical protein